MWSDELDSIGSDSQLVDPPPVLVQEPVEPPPPLLGTDLHHPSGQVKRGHSPLSSPTLHHKKLCSPKYQQLQQKFHERSQDAVSLQQNEQHGGLRLFTPHAPTMQQLLISKDPITVRGGRPPAGGTSSSRNVLTDKSHSVLRNLLVSGRDESAGYSVSAPASPAGTPSASCATSPGPHPLREEAKGVKVQGSLHCLSNSSLVFVISGLIWVLCRTFSKIHFGLCFVDLRIMK